jgi:SAM-dependent methyltransferase
MSEASQFLSPAEHYDRFMARYTPSLAAALADVAGVVDGQRVLDVGCGPGGLTAEIAVRTGAERVAAIDPAPQFVAACVARIPGVDAREGVAEERPWEDGAFDAALSCLVIGFMRDADRGVPEMARVTRPMGTVAIGMWDIAGGGMTMLRIFWSVMRDLHPAVPGEQRRPGTWVWRYRRPARARRPDRRHRRALDANADYTDLVRERHGRLTTTPAYRVVEQHRKQARQLALAGPGHPRRSYRRLSAQFSRCIGLRLPREPER